MIFDDEIEFMEYVKKIIEKDGLVKCKINQDEMIYRTIDGTVFKSSDFRKR